MEHGEDVMEQVLHAQAQAVQVALRRVRQVGTSLLSAAVETEAFLAEPCREEMYSPVTQFPIAEMAYQGAMRKILVDFPFIGTKPQVPLEHVWLVVWYWTAKKTVSCFPIQPSCVKRPVSMTDKVVFTRATTCEQ